MEDDDHAVWVYMPCGLARIEPSEWYAWVDDSRHVIKTTIFDASDGVRSVGAYGGYGPDVTKSADGRIWFLPWDGVSVIDPHHLPVNRLPPPVHIEQLTANGKTYDGVPGLRLPSRIRDLEIDYTALSFVAPEKVLFRYKLEGFNRNWHEAGTRRQVFYANVPPGNYRFRVMACNNSGVWNEAGAALDFSVAPAFYQTWWFSLSCVVLFVAVLWALYKMRMRQVAERFNVRMEERVNERVRIARELHDTLLQSFQGVLLKFYGLSVMLVDRPEAQRKLEGLVEEARQAVTEGRQTVQGLRSSTVVTNQLAQAIRALAVQLNATHSNGDAPECVVAVAGGVRELAPIVRDDVYRIAAEAVRNAFRHAAARRIEVEISYDARQFRLWVRDDGRGIDQTVLDTGSRAGHYGLPGMSERAIVLGGKLEVRSKMDSGTEMNLTIPASRAYRQSHAPRRSPFLRKGA
jgi:signal transduction histidine kinase